MGPFLLYFFQIHNIFQQIENKENFSGGIFVGYWMVLLTYSNEVFHWTTSEENAVTDRQCIDDKTENLNFPMISPPIRMTMIHDHP